MPQRKLEQALMARPAIKDPEAAGILQDLFAGEQPVPPDFDDKGKMTFMGSIPPAPAFRKGPNVVGSPQLAKTVDDILKQFPQLRGSIHNIIGGPTAGSMRTMIHSNLKPDEFLNTTLLGVTDHSRNNEIGVSEPNKYTLLHEMSHAKGQNEGGAQTVEELYKRMLGDKEGKIPSGSKLETILPHLPTSKLAYLLQDKQ